MTAIDEEIILGDLTFNGTADSNGTRWWCNDITGWDGPGLRQSFGAPTSRHGGVVLESMLDTRPIVLGGTVQAACGEDMWLAYNEMLGRLNNLVAPVDLEVVEPTPKHLGVIRAGPPRLDIRGTTMFDFSIALMATDPVKYGVTPVSVVFAAGQERTLSIGGNWPTAPVFSLGHGVANLKNGAFVLATTPNIMGGGSVLNMKAHTLYAGTVNAYYCITPASVWWSLQPGVNVVKNQGTAAVTMTYSEAWL
jgi:hypothetical protein